MYLKSGGNPAFYIKNVGIPIAYIISSTAAYQR